MIEDGNFKYDNESVKTFVEDLVKKNANFAEDIAAIDEAGKTVSILISSVGQRYNWTERTAYVKLAIDSVAHELHHAAQHAKLGDNDSAVFTSEKGRLALEVSALATGEAADGGNATRKVKEMLPIYHKEAVYACAGGVDAALSYAFGKKHMAYSKARMDKLGIVESACK